MGRECDGSVTAGPVRRIAADYVRDMFDLADPVARAEAYPFDVPDRSFLFRGEAPVPRAGRVPVVCIGSNAAPSRLSVKLAGDEDPVPLDEAVLHGHAVVYSAHVAAYGSVPATVVPAGSRARTRVFVAWFTPAQLARIDASEGVPGRYRRVVRHLRLETVGGGILRRAHLYVGGAGPLRLRGRPVRLAEVASVGTPLPALTQPALLRLLARRLARGEPYRAFVRRLVTDADFRGWVNGRLGHLDEGRG